MTMENFNFSPEIDEGEMQKYREFDEKLKRIFAAYENEGKLVDRKISGKNYSIMQQEVEAEFPGITASVFNPYLLNYKKIRIVGYNAKPTTKIIRPGSFLGHPAPPSAPPTVSYGDLAGNDDTRKDLQD